MAPFVPELEIGGESVAAAIVWKAKNQCRLHVKEANMEIKEANTWRPGVYGKQQISITCT